MKISPQRFEILWVTFSSLEAICLVVKFDDDDVVVT
jgi:hypothetical protein